MLTIAPGMHLSPLIPIIGVFIAVGTIHACNVISHEYGHIPLWFEYPQISLTGIHQPERSVYAIGFALSALVLYYAGRVLGAALEKSAQRSVSDEGTPPLPEDDPSSPRRLLSLLRQANIAAIVAAAGLALQGVVPLSSSACAISFEPSKASLDPPPECSDLPELIASMLHALIGANAFFLGSFIHGYLLTSALASPAAPPALRASYSRYIKQGCLGLALFGGFVGTLLHPGELTLAPSGGGISIAYETALEQGGFAQRWAVACLIAYWASFAIDMYAMGL